MPKAIDLSHVVYQVTDLEAMEAFLRDFGLATADKTAETLHMRTAGSAPYVHVSHLGSENRFIGGGFEMGTRADLETLARLPGSSPVEPIEDAPGGGWRVRMTAPDGFLIDAVWGRQEAPALPHRPPNPFNWGERKQRVNQSLRPRREPGMALRLGHFVLRVSDHDAALSWFRERFGLLASDVMRVPGDEDRVIGTFLRFDRGDEPVDHHCVLINRSSTVGVHHCSFEMQDIDSVMGAHDYLKAKGYRHDCGVGRHLIGSQIFDYWRDPFDFRVEHYTDGDVSDSSYETRSYAVAVEDTTQWGMDPTPDFFD